MALANELHLPGDFPLSFECGLYLSTPGRSGLSEQRTSRAVFSHSAVKASPSTWRAASGSPG